jgi:hypothetical protein
MRQKFSIGRRVLLVSAALLVLGAGIARGADITLAPGAPERYVVQKGDTLWSIAQKFLRDPWRWPEIWRLNREQIKSPHWIYPGDVIVLERGAAGTQPQVHLERETVRLSPTIRSRPLDVEAIASIPAGDIEPYLSRPLVTGPGGLANAAQIVAGRDSRVVRGEGDTVYVVGIDRNAGDLWYIYRTGRTLHPWGDEETVLGYEQLFLGTAKVERFDDVSTVRILTAREEILVGDRLIPAPREEIVNYIPHAPDRPVEGHIIDLYRNATEAGRGWLVTLDKGSADGVDVGTVLAISRTQEPIPDPRPWTTADRFTRFTEQSLHFKPEPWLELPDQRTGLLFVYRVYDSVSFAILFNTTDPIDIGNIVHNP